MSSFVSEYNTYQECKDYVDKLVYTLSFRNKIIRVKIESPIYEEYIERSVYIESHIANDTSAKYPTSRNKLTGKYMSTDRVYDRKYYQDFIKRCKQIEGAEIELCLYDDYIREDFD